MLKKKLLVGGAAIAVVAILFTLPRVVVDNGESTSPDEHQEEVAASETEAIEGTPHLPEVSDEVTATLATLRKNYQSSENTEKSSIFADSLITTFQQVGWYDSAAHYAGQLARSLGSVSYTKKALELYYEGFTLALNERQTSVLGEKVRNYGAMVLDSNPNDLEAKSMMAMTYLATEEPMRGIQMLRDVVAEDEDNELALYNLGLLSMQSGQYDKAVDRFQTVIGVNPAHLQAQFFLGVSYAETGKKKKARRQFEKIKTLSDDPEILANADNYLSKL